MKSFKLWLEEGESTPEIDWEVWKDWTHDFDLFVYGDMLEPENRPLEDLRAARARGMVRVFDVPLSNDKAGLSMRRTGRIEDTVNGGITKIPAEDIANLAEKYKHYKLAEITVVRIDERTGLPLKKSQKAYYSFRPDRAQKKLQPDKTKVRKTLKAAYNISPDFGDEFVKTTFRLPKRGSRLVRITR